MLLARAVGGDYSGNVEVRIGWLAFGPTAEKFKGLWFLDSSIKYEEGQLKRVTQLLTNGTSSMGRFGIELTDNKHVILEQDITNKAFQCLLMYAQKNNIMEKASSNLSNKFGNIDHINYQPSLRDGTIITDRIPCPCCAEQIKREATICPFCKQAIFSKDKGSNAILNIIISIVLFCLFYFVIGSFIDYQSEKDYNKIMDRATLDTKRIMRELQQ